MNLAPIILFVYNRPWHTQQTLEALMVNTLADQSTLYIYCDGPKEHATQDEKQYILKVRELIKQKHWCKHVIIIERDTNLGLANSVIQGVTEVIEKHESVIVLEDDLLTGKFFLQFMNDGLNTYKDEKKVFGISGYKFTTEREILEPTYFLPISSSWSYATWIDRWNKVSFDSERLLKDIKIKKLENKLDFGKYPYCKMLEDQIQGKIDSWAIRFYVSMFLQNNFFLFPNISLVQNIGFDNSGTHCNNDKYFNSVVAKGKTVLVEKMNVELNRKSVNLIEKSLQSRKRVKNNKVWIFSKIKSIFK